MLSKAWFCELTFDRHLLYLTCQLHSGLPHLQHVVCKHRPNPSSQEESYRAHDSTFQLLCACQTHSLRLFFFLVCMSVCVSVYHFRVDKRIRTIPAVNPTKAKKKCNFWFQHHLEELLAMDGNCEQGYKPTHLLVSQLQWESMKWLSQTESVLRNAARIVLVLQNTMTSSFGQYDTQVYLPSP